MCVEADSRGFDSQCRSHAAKETAMAETPRGSKVSSLPFIVLRTAW